MAVALESLALPRIDRRVGLDRRLRASRGASLGIPYRLVFHAVAVCCSLFTGSAFLLSTL
jgi:hypothetical protein